MALRTPLFDLHKKLNARMVEFAGWEMPIQYNNLKDEHLAVRKNVGLFDVSHMGEIRVTGPNALESLQWLTTNDVSKLNDGDAQYSLLPNNKGGLVDDIIVYCLKKESDYLVCVNAANTEKDLKWIIENNKGATIKDESPKWGQIAIQGPNAMALIKRVLSLDLSNIPPFRIKEIAYQTKNILLATTGYTGEKGAEVFVPWELTTSLWIDLLENGKDLGVTPIGLGARDTLRTEMKYSLYGHEINDQLNPYESGLGWVIKPDAKEFIGKDIILDYKKQGLRKKLVGFKMIGKGIPRQDYKICLTDGQEIGWVTSGTHSPSLDYPIGIGYVNSDSATLGSKIYIDIRGRLVDAEVCPTPFVNRN